VAAQGETSPYGGAAEEVVTLKGYDGTVEGPDEAPALGASLTFHVTDMDGFSKKEQPYLYATAHVHGMLVYGELKLVEKGKVNFPKFGFDSHWSAGGGFAECRVQLVAYSGLKEGGTIAHNISFVDFQAGP
jgi:hypothetical protein